MFVSSRTCGRGYGNDSAGEGLGFKNNHLGGSMASRPQQLCWIPILARLGCAGLPVWAVSAWEWSWGEHSSAVGVGPHWGWMPACALLCPTETACAPGRGWHWAGVSGGHLGRSQQPVQRCRGCCRPCPSWDHLGVSPGATGTFFQDEWVGTVREAVVLSPESGVTHRLTLKGLSLSASSCLGPSCQGSDFFGQCETCCHMGSAGG